MNIKSVGRVVRPSRWRFSPALQVGLALWLFLLSFHPLRADDNVLVNGNFELGTLDNWVTEGEVTLITDTNERDLYTNNALVQVVEGTFAARIGDEIPWMVEGAQSSRLSQEVIVPARAEGQEKIALQFAYAVVANDPPAHLETDKPLFKVTITDLDTQELLYDTDYVYTDQTSKSWYLGSDPTGRELQSIVSGDRWVFQPWQPVEVDLTDRVGHRILLDFQVRDCNPQAHAAYGYLDGIRLGTPLPMNLPKPEGTLIPADYIAPNLFNILFGWVEVWHLWAWCWLLPLLLLLLPLLFLLFRRRTPSYAGGGGFSSPVAPPKPPRPQDDKRNLGRYRPESPEERQSGGGGGIRPSDKK